MTRDELVEWVRGEFGITTLATQDDTIYQMLENAIRYWNTHSAFKTVYMASASSVTTAVQLPAYIKNVIRVLPAAPPMWIMQNYPTWSLLGISILDNVNADLAFMNESFKNYMYYTGASFRWHFEMSENSAQGGYLYVQQVPDNSTHVCVIGTRRILSTDADITTQNIYEWLIPYTKALVKMVEGNTLRKSGAIDVKNDGQELVNEGKEEKLALEEKLIQEGRWTAFVRRF